MESVIHLTQTTYPAVIVVRVRNGSCSSPDTQPQSEHVDGTCNGCTSLSNSDVQDPYGLVDMFMKVKDSADQVVDGVGE